MYVKESVEVESLIRRPRNFRRSVPHIIKVAHEVKPLEGWSCSMVKFRDIGTKRNWYRDRRDFLKIDMAPSG